PRPRARREGLPPSPPRRARARRLGRAARRPRSPCPARPLARLGPPATRPRPQSESVRAHPRGGAVRRALLLHGAARARPRAARLARRRPLVERLGDPAAALVLPVRPRRGRGRARGPRGAREGASPAVTTRVVAARTGAEFLEGLNAGGREVWLGGERITHPLEHPDLRAAALSMARVFDLQHEHADEMLAPSPDDGRLVNVTHLIPASREDLERRRRAIELTAALSAGTMGRTPDYLNVTFACFAGRADVWARRGNEQGAANIVAYQKTMRDLDLSTTHALINPQVDRSQTEAEQALGEVSLHKIGETPDAIVVRGARMLATLAPFADDLLCYPGSDIRPQDGRYALSFAVPIATPGLKFICRDSFSKRRDAFDYPLSSRFDEMDCVVVFDDVEVPKERVFLDGDTAG